MLMRTVLLIPVFFLFSIGAFADVMIDDFEQNNSGTNNLGHYAGNASGGPAGTNSSSWFGADVLWAAKNGTRGGHFVCTNKNGSWSYAVLFEVLDETSPYTNLSDNYNFHKLCFWIKQAPETKYPGPMKIREVRLEQTNETRKGWVRLESYNSNSSVVKTNWHEIVIPMSDFTQNKMGGFRINSVKSFIIDVTNTVIGAFYIDDIKIVSGVQIKLTDSSNTTTASNQEHYSSLIGGPVRIKITERSNKTGCTGKISISPSSSSGVTNQNMIEGGNGQYYYDWGITGKADGNYSVECKLNNTYATDQNGSNDSGTDLTITLYGGNGLRISGIGSYNQNYPADNDNNYLEATPVYVRIQELNNTTAASGFIDIDPKSRTGITNATMTEAGSGQYYYVWNTTGLSNGIYSIETLLKKSGMTNDMNGFNDSGVDLVIRITNGLNISSIASAVGNDKDNDYFTGDKVKIKITEKNYCTGCEARIIIDSAGSTNINRAFMTDLSHGEYEYEWDTTGFSAGTYYVETTLTNSSHPSYRPDKDGSNDTGPDLVITLSEKASPKDQPVVLWNNYPKPGEPIKIFINSPDPVLHANEEVSIKIYTLSGILITEIKKAAYQSIPRPLLWYGDKSGKSLSNGVYIIYVKGAGIDAFKKVYLNR